MRAGPLIGCLLGAAVALASQSVTLVRAADGTALPPAGFGVLTSSLKLTGDRTAVRLQTRRTSVASALAALAGTYHVSYRSAVALDELRDGTYTGSLRYVIGRLLDGYNYFIEENNATLDIFVVGKSSAKATPAPTMPVVRQHRIPVTYRISRGRP